MHAYAAGKTGQSLHDTKTKDIIISQDWNIVADTTELNSLLFSMEKRGHSDSEFSLPHHPRSFSIGTGEDSKAFRAIIHPSR